MSCEECGKVSGVRLAYRLNPVNWHRITRRLCCKCRTKLGFAPIQYGHSKWDYEVKT